MCAPSWQLSDRRTRAKPSRMVVYESNHAGLGCAPRSRKRPCPLAGWLGQVRGVDHESARRTGRTVGGFIQDGSSRGCMRADRALPGPAAQGASLAPPSSR